MVDDSGFIYCANGRDFRWLASLSVRSLLCHHDRQNVQIFADEIDGSLAEFEDIVTRLPAEFASDQKIIRKASKIYAMNSSRFKKTCYLDCDTYIHNSLEAPFALLESFDLAMARDLHGHYLEGEDLKIGYNTGVVFYNSSRVKDLFHDWLTGFYKSDGSSDQYVLMSLLHQDINNYKRIYTLGDGFNLRAGLPCCLSGRLYVLHQYPKTGAVDSFQHLRAIAEFVDSVNGYRTYDPRRQSLVHFDGVTTQEDILNA
jgi:hypothetical protein